MLLHQFLLRSKFTVCITYTKIKTYSNYIVSHENFKQIQISKQGELIHNHQESEFEHQNT